jgi:hypothetical protein
MATEPTNDLLFMQLIMQNQQLAMMSLGKLKNPMTDKIERNLDYAKYAIDTLDMLKEKTKGNLSDYEDRFITEVIRELKLNYVDEVNKDKSEAAPKDSEKEKTSDTSSEAAKPDDKGSEEKAEGKKN